MMSCLVHDKRFRSSFHSIINELRNEKRMPLSIIQTMPRKCCSCNDETKDIIESLVIKEENQFIHLKHLIERINREKQANPKLILSLYRLQNLIEKYQFSDPVLLKSSSIEKQKHLSSSSGHASCFMTSKDESSKNNETEKDHKSTAGEDSCSLDVEDSTPMDIYTPIAKCEKQKRRRKRKSSTLIKDGTFLFLPYTVENGIEKNSDSLVELAKTLQLHRFITRNGHFPLLEKEYDVHINMMTSKTSKQVTKALENAKIGFENLTIHNRKESMAMSEKLAGEWVLVRSKKVRHETTTINMEQLFDDLINRWENCLKIKKRKQDEEDNFNDSIQKRR